MVPAVSRRPRAPFRRRETKRWLCRSRCSCLACSTSVSSARGCAHVSYRALTARLSSTRITVTANIVPPSDTKGNARPNSLPPSIELSANLLFILENLLTLSERYPRLLHGVVETPVLEQRKPEFLGLSVRAVHHHLFPLPA